MIAIANHRGKFGFVCAVEFAQRRYCPNPVFWGFRVLTIANSIAQNIDRVVMAVNLGCGSWGDNSISVNTTPHHLVNIKTVADRRENMLWFRIPPKIYFKSGCLPVALRDLAGKKRALIVTDKPLFELGLI